MLNQWERSIVDRLRYGLQNRQAVTLGADEVHIAMNAIEEHATLTERAKAAEADMAAICNALRDHPHDTVCCFACKFNDSSECPGHESDECFAWRGPQAQAGDGVEHE